MEKLEIKNDLAEMNVEADSITIKKLKKENHTLDDLRQKLINDLYEANYYENNEIELLKLLLENEKKTTSSGNPKKAQKCSISGFR